MLKWRKNQPWAEDAHRSCRAGRVYQWQTALDRVLFCVIALVAFGSPSIVFAVAPCDYYASPSGSGNGLSESTPFKIADFWSVAGPGKTLCLLDGTYTGSSSMITPPENLSGVSGSPITVRAVNDGKVTLNGQGARQPVKLRYNNWFVLEGFNAHDSSYYVLELSRSDNNIVRRVVAWNAAIDKNNHVFGVPYSKFTLLEDVAGFGTGRKIFETFKTTDITIRRAWGRWEGSNQIGPKMTYSLFYNSRGTEIENSIGTWSGEMMSGKPDQPYGIFGMDRIDSDDRKARIKLLGSISYVTNADTFYPDQQVFITKVDEVELKDLVAYYESGSKQTALLMACKVVNDGTAPNCPNPNLTVTNMTNIGGNVPSISSQWQQTNIVSGPNTSAIFSASENLFVNSGNVGATICKRYVDGVLTQEPLWPWPMDQRIYDALQQAGKTPFYVTNVIEDMFGPIPSECKQAQGGGSNDPPSPPSGLQFN